MSFRALAMIEASVVSGSAKAVLEFATVARNTIGLTLNTEVSLVVFHRGPQRPVNPLMNAAEHIGLATDVVYEKRAFDLSVVRQLRDIIKRRQPDVIWSNSVKSHFLVRYAGLNQVSRWVAFHHGYTTTDTKMLIYNQLDRWSLPTCDGVMTVCQPFAKELIQKGVPENRIHVQHMPVRSFTRPDSSVIAEMRARHGIPQSASIVLCVGRLSREKAHADLLFATATLQAARLNREFRLLVVGEGPEHRNLKALQHKLGLQNVVIFAGQQNDMAAYYGAADMFVLPSHSEGSPNVLLEAYAAGIPVVATAVGGVPEMAWDGETAVLVTPNNPQQLGEALLRVINASEQFRNKLTTNAMRIAETRHTPEAYYDSVARFLRASV